MRDGGSAGSRMGRVVDFLHPVAREVRIDLRRAEALMPKQFLDAAKISAVVQKMRGKAVP